MTTDRDATATPRDRHGMSDVAVTDIHEASTDALAEILAARADSRADRCRVWTEPDLGRFPAPTNFDY